MPALSLVAMLKNNQYQDKTYQKKNQAQKPFSSNSFKNTFLKLKLEIPKSVKDNRRQFAEPIWQVIVNKVGKEGKIKEKEIAEEVGCSIKTVQRVLKGFENCKLIKIKPYNGPGEGIRVKNKWLIEGEKIIRKFLWKLAYEAEKAYLRDQGINSNSLGTTGLDNVSSILSKGSPQWRKIALKFRKMVESLTNHAKYSSVVVGKCLQIIADRHIDLARNLYQKVKRFLARETGLSAFYQWLRGWYLPTNWNLLSRHQDELTNKDRSKEIKEAHLSWQGIPTPPSIGDFSRTADWLEATNKWHQKYVEEKSIPTNYQQIEKGVP